MKKFLIYSSLIIISIICNNCNQPEELTVYNSDLVFPNSFVIQIEDYSYIDESDGSKYFVNTDSAMDTLSSRPVLRWSNDLNGLTTVAIATEPFEVEKGEIKNVSSVIWQWHTGMSKIMSDTSGSLTRYSDGKPVFNKKIEYDTQPLPLQNGLYFWAVWKWDITGKRIIASSRNKKFIVQN